MTATKPKKVFASWTAIPFAIMATTVLSIAWFLFVEQTILALVFIVYAIILIVARIRLRSLIDNFRGAQFVRIAVRQIIFLLPLFFLGWPTFNWLSWGVLASVGWGAIFLILRWSELQFNLSSEFIAILPPLSKEGWWGALLNPLLSAITQEYFYRGVMLALLSHSIGFGSVVIAALFFTLEHRMYYNSAKVFDKRDYIYQAMLSLGLGIIFFFSGSLAGAILGHAVYNSPEVLQTLQREIEE